MLGEIREGKGINRLLDALVHFPEEIKLKAIFLIVGNAKDVDPEKMRKLFKKHGVQAHIVSERVTNDYKLVSDPELAEYVSASDIGLLLFEKSQKSCMSGILPNYIMNDIPIFSSHDSIVGEFVEAYRTSMNACDIGWTSNISDPAKLAKTLSYAINYLSDNKNVEFDFIRIKQIICYSSVLGMLDSIINE